MARYQTMIGSYGARGSRAADGVFHAQGGRCWYHEPIESFARKAAALSALATLDPYLYLNLSTFSFSQPLAGHKDWPDGFKGCWTAVYDHSRLSFHARRWHALPEDLATRPPALVRCSETTIEGRAIEVTGSSRARRPGRGQHAIVFFRYLDSGEVDSLPAGRFAKLAVERSFFEPPPSERA